MLWSPAGQIWISELVTLIEGCSAWDCGSDRGSPEGDDDWTGSEESCDGGRREWTASGGADVGRKMTEQDEKMTEQDEKHDKHFCSDDQVSEGQGKKGQGLETGTGTRSRAAGSRATMQWSRPLAEPIGEDSRVDVGTGCPPTACTLVEIEDTQGGTEHLEGVEEANSAAVVATGPASVVGHQEQQGACFMSEE